MKLTWSISAAALTTLISASPFSASHAAPTQDSIPAIRQRYAAINKNIRKYKTVRKELSGFSLEGGELIAYFNGPRIVKITAAYFGESGRATEEYYYSNEKLIFVFRRDYTYNEPMSGKVVSTIANRFYFGNDRLIRWIDEKGMTRSSAESEYQAKQKELLETSTKFMMAARLPERVIEARNIRAEEFWLSDSAVNTNLASVRNQVPTNGKQPLICRE
jgi:hypothetical protein